ncbi:sulfurtransferase TusA family protein [Vibrio sp. WXL103]|uniref:sulfurtransferase TusA family protein n=1 Tax=unclassified Vibrio TaxID=2614977 RepID=UPI003EC5C8E7
MDNNLCNLLMSDNYLDLTQQGCPQALLLFKRFWLKLPASSVASVRLQDGASYRDIERYMVAQSISYTLHQSGDEINISLKKDK